MIELLKIKNSTSKGYFYLPEGKQGPGIIEITDGEVIVAELSSYEKELGAPYYANKAKAEVMRLLETGNLVDRKILAWY